MLCVVDFAKILRSFKRMVVDSTQNHIFILEIMWSSASHFFFFFYF